MVAAELSRRLLAPRAVPMSRSPVDSRDYFSPEEIDRGRRFARPQLALGLAREAIGGAVVAGAVIASRRGPAGRRRLGPGPVVGGAMAASGLATAATVAGLPLAAWGRRRAIAVGLVTQPW
jgi:hypothetical protein